MESKSIKNSGVWYIAISIIAFFADYLSKTWIINNIKAYDLNSFITVIPDFFRIVHVHNEGAAFSFLADNPGWQQWLFGIMAIGISLFLTWQLCKLPARAIWKNISFALIIGGALGNLFDRLVYGYVIDFLDFFAVYGGSVHHYPAFNIADCAICVGVFMVLISELFMHKQKTK